MGETRRTQDHDEIEQWADELDGEPALNDKGELRIDFEGLDELEHISWKEFFEIMEDEGLSFELYRYSPTEDHEDIPKSERYSLVTEPRETVKDMEDTEMDSDIVQENVKETEE